MAGLIIPKLCGFKEEDNFKEGCLTETSFNVDVDISFEGKTQEEIINKICEYFDITKENLLLNSCEEKGRIDIQILEDENSLSVNDNDTITLNKWKKGEIKLWSATYTGYLHKQEIQTWRV